MGRPCDLIDHVTPPGEVVARDGLRVRDEFGIRSAVDDATAVFAGSRADIDDPVGGADGVFVMLDDDERVAQALELDEGVDEAPIVALVQPDRRFVEHIQHSREPRTDLSGETDALRLASRQRASRARHAEVAKAHLQQELKTSPNLAQHGSRDRCFTIGQRDGVHEGIRVEQAQLCHGRNAVPINRDGKNFGLETRTIAL